MEPSSVSAPGTVAPRQTLWAERGSLWGGLILLLALGACQTYQPKPLDPITTAADFAARSLDDQTVSDALDAAGILRPKGNEGWTADALGLAAEALHPSIARARAELAAYAAATDAAGARPPVGINVDLQRATSARSPWTYGFTLDGLVEFGNKRARRVEQARAAQNEAAVALAETTWRLRAEVLRAVAALELTRERQAGQTALRAALVDWETVQARRAELGAGNHLEALTIQHELAQLALDEAETAKRAAVSRTTLAQSLGLPVKAVAGLVCAPLPEALPAMPDPDALQDRVAVENPAVLAALAHYASREAALRLEIAAQYPDLRLGPGFSYDQGQHKWLLGSGLTFPLDRNRAAIAHARAELASSAAAFRETQAKAFGTLSQALADYAGSLATVERASALAKTSERAAQAQEDLLAIGAADRVAVVQASVQAQRDRVAWADSRAAAWFSFFQLQDAVGASLHPFADTHP